MDVSKRDPIDVISESLIEQIAEEINKSIIEKLKGQYWWNSENDKLYRDKYQIISHGDKEIPFNVYVKINELINKEISQGYIECKYKNRNGKIIHYQIPLDKLHSVSFIWDYIEPNSIIRMHQTEAEYKKSQEPLQPIFLNYELDLTHTPTISNFVDNKTIVKGKYYIDPLK